MSVTLPGTGSIVETIDGTAGAQRQVVQVANLPTTQAVSGTVSLDSTALAALGAAATPGTQPVSLASVPLPTGAATASGVAAVVTALGTPFQAGEAVSVSNFPSTQPVSNTAVGAAADTAATTDGGTFSLIALTKRLLGKLPSALGAQTSAASLGVVLASDQAMIATNTLGQPGVARKITANGSAGASTNQALTTTTRRISIVALGSALRYVIGTGAQTATSSSHYIQQGERLDLAVPASAQIAVLSDTTTAGSLELTELV